MGCNSCLTFLVCSSPNESRLCWTKNYITYHHLETLLLNGHTGMCFIGTSLPEGSFAFLNVITTTTFCDNIPPRNCNVCVGSSHMYIIGHSSYHKTCNHNLLSPRAQLAAIWDALHGGCCSMLRQETLLMDSWWHIYLFHELCTPVAFPLLTFCGSLVQK